MIIDNFQLETGWKSHTQADGSQIGGVPPVDYGMTTLPGGAILFHTQGSTVPGGYADWEAYISRPILPNAGYLMLSFDITVDSDAATYAQAIETDTILCLGGWNYNLSMQLNYALGGMLQIAGSGGRWVNTGIAPGKLSPNVKHHYDLAYAFDTTAKKCSFLSISLDGTIHSISSSLQNVLATNNKWSDGVIFQVQQDLNGKAGKFSMLIDNAQYVWS